MRIVRPHGSSRSQGSAGALRRVLIDNTPKRNEHLIPAFAGVPGKESREPLKGAKDELIIAQWISAIDKIARKPTGRNKPTRVQYDLRHKLGNRCWLRLTEGGHLPDVDAARLEFLRNVWWFKIHPYGNDTEEPRAGKPAPEIKGRWYQVFAGDGEPEDVRPDKAREIAERIEQHLYEREYRLGPDAKRKLKGRIALRAESIEGNVLHRREKLRVRSNKPEWTEADKAAYLEPCNPVEAIRKAAEDLEDERARATDAEDKAKRVTMALAGKILFEHWAKVFRDPVTGAPMSVPQAREKHPGLFALHDRLKQCYRGILKRARKDTRKHRERDEKERRVSALLPPTLDKALGLTEKQDVNADLGHLVRLGKVLHYEAAERAANALPTDKAAWKPGDRPAALRTHWPDTIDGSRYWASDGQAEIKRAEAFVRIWRRALALAGVTLKDWIGFRGDILGGTSRTNPQITQEIEAIRSDESKRTRFNGKVQVLFGKRAAELKLVTDDDRIAFFRGVLEGAEKLRHASFHFKGRGQLLDVLDAPPESFAAIKNQAHALWRKEAAERTARLKAELIGAHVEEYLTQEQATRVFHLLTGDTLSELPLPRFARLLQRAEAWKEEGIDLPEPANRRALEDHARLCQYKVLSLIYERPFRAWLARRPAADISAWFDRAVARSTDAAKAENAKGDEVARKVIEARAVHLPKPGEDEDIIDLLSKLSAATASEMRIQRGYASDREKAREQAGFVESLLRDVVVLSFSAYLTEEKFDWALALKPGQTPLPTPCSLKDLASSEPDLAAEDWQAALYLVLHLLPVESVGRLMHQIMKWDIAAARDAEPEPSETARLRRLRTAMTLYLDMHDAKFEGGDALTGCEEFRVLFDPETGFDRVVKDPAHQRKDGEGADGPEADRRIPWRGLREITRFGHLPLLKTISRGRKIDNEMITRVHELEEAPDGAESKIALLQKKREDLHAKWVDNKDLGAADLRDYCQTLAAVSAHRREANFIYLVDHVRAHRTIMDVLGRLIDFSGLFERDLYFVTLALLYRSGLRPDAVFKGESLDRLLDGRILEALEPFAQQVPPQAGHVRDEIERHFTDVWRKGNPLRGIRNALAHLNMLQVNRLQKEPLRPGLTHWVNQARQLMGYDRKLKNAVSQSVIELMERENIDLRWRMDSAGATHNLFDAKLSSRCASHLGNKRLTLEAEDPKDKKAPRKPLEERLQGDDYLAMLAAAFEGTYERAESILDDLKKVDWDASVAKRRPRPDSGPHRPHAGKTKAPRKPSYREHTARG